MSGMGALWLGLIGDNIKSSHAPLLHREAGRLCGIEIRYDLLIPAELGVEFDALIEKCRQSGMRGVNVTHPYKQRAAASADVEDPQVRRLGAVNTVIFENGRMLGHNTDHSGFIAAYRGQFGNTNPGPTMILGAGGAGRAVAFALVALGAPALIIVDTDAAKANVLVDDLRRTDAVPVEVGSEASRKALQMEGIVNCTPVGMIGHPGMPVEAAALAGLRWGFEAIYTPERTDFLLAAQEAGVRMMGGYELFIHQGIDAFRLFTGRTVDEAAMRAILRGQQPRLVL